MNEGFVVHDTRALQPSDASTRVKLAMAKQKPFLLSDDLSLKRTKKKPYTLIVCISLPHAPHTHSMAQGQLIEIRLTKCSPWKKDEQIQKPQKPSHKPNLTSLDTSMSIMFDKIIMENQATPPTHSGTHTLWMFISIFVFG